MALLTRNSKRRRRQEGVADKKLHETLEEDRGAKKCMRRDTCIFYYRAIIGTTWNTFCRVGNVKI